MECDLECGRQNKVNYINARAPSLKLISVVTTFEVRSKETHANWSLYVAVVYHRGTYTPQLLAEEFHRIFSRDHYCDCAYHLVIVSWSSTICASPAFSKDSSWPDEALLLNLHRSVKATWLVCDPIILWSFGGHCATEYYKCLHFCKCCHCILSGHCVEHASHHTSLSLFTWIYIVFGCIQ